MKSKFVVDQAKARIFSESKRDNDPNNDSVVGKLTARIFGESIRNSAAADNLLTAANTEWSCRKAARNVLHTLAQKGISNSQIAQTTVEDLEVMVCGNEEEAAADPEEAATTAQIEPRRLCFVPSPLQDAILTALKGHSLKKQSLADEVCAGEGSRLYRKNGIKELIANGIVEHKYGVGYYRTDFPPPNALELTKH